MTGEGAQGVNVVLPGKGEEVTIPGFGATYKLYGRDTGGEVSIVEHPFAVGIITAPHRHTGEDEHSIVLEGEIGFRSDDSEVVLGAGGYITKPRGQMHAMWNAGDVPGRIVEIITPGGFEDYFRQLGELLAADKEAGSSSSDSLHGTDEFTALASRFGLTYGDPDWLDDVVKRYSLRPPTH
ncbi:cupin domain-containing protein [Streptomyces sp. NBC_01198]|uniref:cupin domain-containing protein n=1 Tax=Streptomyces sp. NBC_01198 TaxID=2903769 RepID=UPI002E152A93|nr:cupin domain-containing protein [Streptomyces sp. NBC_01198]